MGDKETECKCSEIIMTATTCKLAGGSEGRRGTGEEVAEWTDG